jgi:predicted DsbA family dithiol-disulfide isomerase
MSTPIRQARFSAPVIRSTCSRALAATMLLTRDIVQKRLAVEMMKIEIWADVACPWCYVGKRRFEKALAKFDGRDDVEVIWRSFELDPRAPRVQPLTAPEVLARKYRVSVEQANAMNERLKGEARKEGLDLHPEKIRMVNTFDAHRVIHHAAGVGKRAEMVERLFRAYHIEGEVLSDAETLIRLATEAGLDAASTRAVIDGDTYSDEVRGDEERASSFGISGVPFFAIDEKYGVSGAQPTEHILEVLTQALVADS